MINIANHLQINLAKFLTECLEHLFHWQLFTSTITPLAALRGWKHVMMTPVCLHFSLADNLISRAASVALFVNESTFSLSGRLRRPLLPKMADTEVMGLPLAK
jgi:hypothetical protein